MHELRVKDCNKKRGEGKKNESVFVGKKEGREVKEKKDKARLQVGGVEGLLLANNSLLERFVVVQVGTETTQVLNTGNLE